MHAYTCIILILILIYIYIYIYIYMIGLIDVCAHTVHDTLRSVHADKAMLIFADVYM